MSLWEKIKTTAKLGLAGLVLATGISFNSARADPISTDYFTPSCHWKFDGNAEDSSGRGNDLVNSGVQYSEGKLGQAAEFKNNGGGQYFLLTNREDINFEKEDFTIAAWFKTNANNIDDMTLITKGGWSSGCWDIYIWRQKNDPTFPLNHELRLLGNDGSNWSVKYHSKNPINDGNWHRFVYTRDNPTGNVKAYLDNEETSLIKDYGTTMQGDFTNNSDLLIGKVGNSQQILQYSFLDDVRLYKGYSWTADDVTYDWNNGEGRDIPISEPATLALLGSGILTGIGYSLRKRTKD